MLKLNLCVCLALSLSHKGTFNCIFPVLGIVPFTVCMKWSYNTVYLPAAELNENNKKLNLTDGFINLLKTFSIWGHSPQPNLQGKSFYSFFPSVNWNGKGTVTCYSHKWSCGENEWGYSSWFIPWLLTLWRGGGRFHSYLNSHSHKKKKYSDILTYSGKLKQ